MTDDDTNELENGVVYWSGATKLGGYYQLVEVTQRRIDGAQQKYLMLTPEQLAARDEKIAREAWGAALDKALPKIKYQGVEIVLDGGRPDFDTWWEKRSKCKSDT